MFKNFDFSWFLTTPGILTGVGCLLILISIIIFLSSLKGKKKNKEEAVEANQTAEVPDANPVNLSTEPINFAKTMEPTPMVNDNINVNPEVAPVTPVNPTPEVTPVNVETVVTPVEPVQPTQAMPEPVPVQPVNVQPESVSMQAVTPTVNPINIEPQITPVEPVNVTPEPVPTEAVTPTVNPVNIEPQITPVEPVNITPEPVPMEAVTPTVNPINIEPQITPLQTNPQPEPVSIQPVQTPAYPETPQAVLPEGTKNIIYGGADPINGTGIMPQINPEITKKDDIESL